MEHLAIDVDVLREEVDVARDRSNLQVREDLMAT